MGTGTGNAVDAWRVIEVEVGGIGDVDRGREVGGGEITPPLPSDSVRGLLVAEAEELWSLMAEDDREESPGAPVLRFSVEGAHIAKAAVAGLLGKAAA